MQSGKLGQATHGRAITAPGYTLLASLISLSSSRRSLFAVMLAVADMSAPNSIYMLCIQQRRYLSHVFPPIPIPFRPPASSGPFSSTALVSTRRGETGGSPCTRPCAFPPGRRSCPSSPLSWWLAQTLTVQVREGHRSLFLLSLPWVGSRLARIIDRPV